MTGEARHSREHEGEEYQDKENATLVEASFAPMEGEDLWMKNGVCYGREAALQTAWRKLREGGNGKVLDET
jgi:hypothetical protein